MSSSIAAQSVLMALTVTVNKYASSNVQAVHRREERRRRKLNTTSSDTGRRGLLLSTVIAAAALVTDSKSQILQKYLKKSEENKTKNDKERLDNYYKRNYKDYFDFVEGSLKNRKKEELSETEKGILEWLEKNK